MQLKYIRTKSGFTIWPDMTMVFHTDMAALVKEKVISAGFCIFIDNCFVCHGRSDSLDIESQPDDSEAMDKFFGINS